MQVFVNSSAKLNSPVCSAPPCRDTDLLCKAFVTHVGLILECSSQIWSPSYLTPSTKLNNVTIENFLRNCMAYKCNIS